MEDNKGSKTAEAAAALRAMHYLYNKQPIFKDPYARHFTSSAWKLMLSNRFFPYLLKNTVLKPIYNAVGGQILSRGKYAEDKLEEAIKNGINQYVILGAGMDTFVLRRPDLKSLKVFEVDHPATQKSKKERFESLGQKHPDNLIFVPVDFERQTISEELANTSFNHDEPAFFSWMATSYYLTRTSIFETLESIKQLAAPKSEIVFDYSIDEKDLSEQGKHELDVTKKFVAKRGEKFLSDFGNQEIIDEVSRLGYELLERADPELIDRTYFSDRKDQLKAAQWCGMVHFRTK